jgi:hypothetical protein
VGPKKINLSGPNKITNISCWYVGFH